MRSFSTNCSEGAFKEFSKELDRTNVISDDFKNTLWQWANAACSEAFQRGVAETKPRKRKKRNP